jgi:hypothetical protein
MTRSTGATSPIVAALHDTSVAMIESHYAAWSSTRWMILRRKRSIPLTMASAEIIDLPRQCAVAGGTAVWPYGQAETPERGTAPAHPFATG